MENKETKFTNGEWVIKDNGHYFDIGPLKYGDVYPSVCIGVQHKDKANAHLIKTAPKLYEALDELISNEDSNLTVNEIMVINELLSEARGE